MPCTMDDPWPHAAAHTCAPFPACAVLSTLLSAAVKVEKATCAAGAPAAKATKTGRKML